MPLMNLGPASAEQIVLYGVCDGDKVYAEEDGISGYFSSSFDSGVLELNYEQFTDLDTPVHANTSVRFVELTKLRAVLRVVSPETSSQILSAIFGEGV